MQGRRESRLRGKRLRVEVLLAGATAPEPLPVNDLVEADLWDQLPADLPDLLALLPQADLYRASMRSNLPSTRPSPVPGLAKADEGNAWSRHQVITARSTALACSTGAMAGSMVALLLDGRPMSFVNKCVPLWRVQNVADVSPS